MAGPAVTDTADFDREVRVAIAECVTERGVVPASSEVAVRIAASESDVSDAFGRLAAARVMILRPGTTDILSFNPFAAGRTDFTVRSAGRDWWGLCAWDAFGIPAALGSDGVVQGACADVCGVPLEVRLAGDAVGALDGVVIGFALPAREWWKDIIFT